jgi:hypothetical protein
MTKQHELDGNASEGQVAEELAQEQAAEDLDVDAQEVGEVTGGGFVKSVDKSTPVITQSCSPPPTQ